MSGNLIVESAIYQRPEIVKKNVSKAIYRMVLQTCDEVNKNRRMYPYKVLKEAMRACDDRIKSRSFFGELDHPLPSGDHDDTRRTVVLLKEVCCILRDYEFRGNILMGEFETTKTKNGEILLGLLLDRAGVGVSMRGLAGLERKGDYDVVQSPLTIISYDAVSLPSHRAAVVNFSELRFENQVLYEGDVKEVDNGKLICTTDGRCYVSKYFDELVNKKIIQFCKKWY